jgi:uncharacterized membrane protein
MGIEQALQYEVPYLHPLAVHFPLVLLLLAAAAAGVYAVRGTAAWRHVVLGLLLLGAPSALWAQRTGDALEEAVEGEPAVERFVEYHEAAAAWTVWASLFALAAAAGASLWWRRKTPVPVPAQEPLGLRLALLVPALVAGVLVAYTGHLGALMVWGVPR